METALYALILTFGIASYMAGLSQMIKGKYSPSIFSRVVWLLLAINSFAGVLLSEGSTSSILLAGIFLAGNAAICMASFWKGSKDFGKLEVVCLSLLVVSAVIWIVFKAPLINLGISLFAHLIGGAPTLRRVWNDPSSESTAFWSFFFIASLLSVFASYGSPLTAMLFPLFYTLFDGAMVTLSMRGRSKH